MTTGTEIRLNRILRKGRMLCIPMDHGISNGPIIGLESGSINPNFDNDYDYLIVRKRRNQFAIIFK